MVVFMVIVPSGCFPVFVLLVMGNVSPRWIITACVVDLGRRGWDICRGGFLAGWEHSAGCRDPWSGFWKDGRDCWEGYHDWYRGEGCPRDCIQAPWPFWGSPHDEKSLPRVGYGLIYSIAPQLTGRESRHVVGGLACCWLVVLRQVHVEQRIKLRMINGVEKLMWQEHMYYVLRNDVVTRLTPIGSTLFTVMRVWTKANVR